MARRRMCKPRHLLGAAILAAYCALAASGGVRPVRYVDIASSGQLRPNRYDDTGRVPFEYRSDADLHAYAQAIVEPVRVYDGADGQFDGLSRTERLDLARYMGARFSKALATLADPYRRPIVRTLRVRLTLTGATRNVTALSALSRFELVGAAYNAIQAWRDREGALMGSASFAVEIYDASTNELLRAYVSKTYPGAWDLAASVGALSASRTALDIGAADLASYLVRG
jgi:hypothetical protein